MLPAVPWEMEQETILITPLLNQNFEHSFTDNRIV